MKHPTSTTRPNVIRHDCEKGGCYNRIHKYPLGRFHDALPRNCQFSDVDGIAEVGGAICIIEFKSEHARWPTAQAILIERITRMTVPGKGKANLGIIAVADNESGTVLRFKRCWAGKWSPWLMQDFEALHAQVCMWAMHVEARVPRRA